MKELESHGLVEKETDSSEMPVKCYYTLTKSGKDFIRIIQQMKEWALRWNIKNSLCKSSDCRNCKISP